MNLSTYLVVTVVYLTGFTGYIIGGCVSDYINWRFNRNISSRRRR